MHPTRLDKDGRHLPDTGRGCGCEMCAEANAARYERRSQPERAPWSTLHRRLVQPLYRLLVS